MPSRQQNCHPLATCRRRLSFLRLRLGTRIGRLGLPAKLPAKPRQCRSQIEPGSASGRNFAYSDRLLATCRSMPLLRLGLESGGGSASPSSSGRASGIAHLGRTDETQGQNFADSDRPLGRFPAMKIPTCGALRCANGTLRQVYCFLEIS
jgi:hypothetical protein